MTVNPAYTDGWSWGYSFPQAPTPSDSDYPETTLAYTADGDIYMIVDNTPGSAVWIRYYKTSLSDSHTATAAFVTSLTAGTAVQNTSGMDLLVNIRVNISACVSASLKMGVSYDSSPTLDAVTDTMTLAGLTSIGFTALVHQGAYLLVDYTGTMSISSITVQSCAI